MSRRMRVALIAAFVGLVSARSLAAGSLSGRVFDAGFQPVAGVRVEWLAFRPIERALLDASRGVDAAVLGSVQTDGDGKFTIAFEKSAGEVSIRMLLRDGCEIEIKGPFDSRIRDELPDLILPPVAGKVSGQVVDEAGRGASDARVELQMAPRSAEGAVLWKTLTGADGTFRFPAVPLVPMSLTVRASRFAISRADVSLPAGPIRVELRHGGRVSGTIIDSARGPVAGAIVVSGMSATETSRDGRFQIDVRAGTASLLAIGPDGRIGRREGIVVRVDQDADLEPLRVAPSACVAGSIADGSSRQPVASALVAATTLRVGPDLDPLAWRAARADGRGRFRICGLASGAHRLEVEHPGYLPAEMDGALAMVEPADGISVALRRESAIAGRVTEEGGAPVAGAHVRLRGVSSAAQAVTTKDGRFRLQRLEPARNAELEAEKVGFAPARRPGLELKEGVPTRVPDLILRLGLRATGTVVDPDGNPLAGVEVRVASEAEKEKLDSYSGKPPRPPDASSDARGRFEVAGLEPGEYRAVFWRDGFADRTVTGLGVNRGRPNEWAPIVLTPGAGIDGRVATGEGQPIAGAHVTSFLFLRSGRPRSTTSDDQGRFHLEDLVPGRPAQISASAEGFVSMSGRRVTPPGADITLTLATAAKLAGHVEDAMTKEPVRAFSLRLVSAHDFWASEDFRSEEGRFVLKTVAPGRWSINVSAPGYLPAVFPVGEVTEGETRESLVFEVRKGLSLSGRILDTRHQGIADARLVVHPPDTAGSDAFGFFEDPRTSTDGEGRFHFEGLSSGKSTLEVSRPGFPTATREVDPETEPSVEVVLETGSRIAGRLVARDAQTRVAGEEIELRGPGRSETEKTGADGSFAFENLANGSYRVSAAGAKTREVSIVEGRSVDDLVLERVGGAVIRGTVAGLPPSRLGLLRITARADDYSAETATDEQGRFVLRDVPEGSVQVHAATDGLPSRVVRRFVEIPETGELSVELVFKGSSCVSGRVTRGGRPVANAWVRADFEPVGPESLRVFTMADDRGFYELEGLTDGDYQIQVITPWSKRRSLRVDGDTVADFELPTGSLRGRVGDAVTGVSLPGAQVRLDVGGDSSSARTAVTDVEGGFELGDLDEGAYTISIAREGYENSNVSALVGSGPTELAVALKQSGAAR